MRWDTVFGQAFIKEARGEQPFPEFYVRQALSWNSCAVGEHAPVIGKKWRVRLPGDYRMSPELAKVRSLGMGFPNRLEDANTGRISVGEAFTHYESIKDAIRAYAKKYKKRVV